MRREVSGCTAAVLKDAVSKICLKQHIVFLRSSHLAFFMRFVCVNVVHPYSSNDTATAWKQFCLILLGLYMIDNLSVAVHAFSMSILASISVDKMLLPRYVNRSTNFRGLPLK